MGKAKSKYNVDLSTRGKLKRTYDGIVFDSILEKKYYIYLLTQKEQGIIKDIDLQPRYELQPSFKYQDRKVRKVEYIADFKVTYNDNSVIVVDVKGKPDSVALLKRKLFMYHYLDIKLVWITWSKTNGGWVEYFDLQKKNKERKKEDSKDISNTCKIK